jgi:hypothetical protein
VRPKTSYFKEFYFLEAFDFGKKKLAMMYITPVIDA